MKSQRTKNTLLQFAQGNHTNQKLQESIFSPTRKKLKNKKSPTLQKNKTSSHRTVQTLNCIASNVNRFVESVCGHEQNRFGRTAAHAGNISLNEILKMGALLVKRTVVLLTNSSGYTNSRASNPPFLKHR